MENPPRVATMVFRVALTSLGIAAVIIGTSMFLMGPTVTAEASNWLLSLVAGTGEPVSGLQSANADSELRFYSVLWIAFGVITIAAARDPFKYHHRITILLVVFFLGGVGRVIAFFQSGEPHFLFIVLMIFELALPPTFIVFWRIVKSRVAEHV